MGKNYVPILPIRLDLPDEIRCMQGLAYWNNLAYDFKLSSGLPANVRVFVIDRTNPQVTWEEGPWGAVGPYPNTDNKWVVYHPASAVDSPGAWHGEAHELGHVLFGNPNHKGGGILGHGTPDASFMDRMKYDRKLLKSLVLAQ